MISTLATLDKQVAAGVLARTAIALDDDQNPSGEYEIPGEDVIRASLLRELSTTYGINLDRHVPEIRNRIAAILDDELEAILGPIDDTAELEKLSNKGMLPSDLYQLVTIPNVHEVYEPKWLAELEYIKATVAHFDREQHFHGPDTGHEVALISLFAKHFVDPQFSNRSFTMLVAGQRHGLRLFVHQAWRLYPDRINIDGAGNLVQMLKRFADEFGQNITVGEKTSKLFVSIDDDLRTGQSQWKVTIEGVTKNGKPVPGARVMMSFFNSSNADNTAISLLALALDIDKYRRMLISHGW